MPKKIEKGDPLVSPGMVFYAGKQEKPFWFSSLGQMVQFGAIIFCRTFKNYFGQFVWIEKGRYNSCVSLHEAPTKNGLVQDSNPSTPACQTSPPRHMKSPLTTRPSGSMELLTSPKLKNL